MVFAWHGWRLEIPEEWSPVKIDGSFESGQVLLADIHRPRLGIRWATPGRKHDGKTWARQTLVNEIGVLAADEAEAWDGPRFGDAFIYREKEPPGRDVWVGRSGVSGRTIEIVHHVLDDDGSKIQDVVKGLVDSRADGELGWAAFDLSCRTPGGWRLESHRLNAGDLKLEFVRKSERMEIRQIAVAHVALKRKSIEKWLEDECRPRMKQYSSAVERLALKVQTQRGLVLEGPLCRLDRRRRILWSVGMPATVWQAALHDAERDRLIFVGASERNMLDNLARSIGWAAEEVRC